MKRNRVSNGVVWTAVTVTLAVVAGTFGCAERDPVAGDTTAEVVKAPDHTEETSRLTANLYGSGNPFTIMTVSRLVARPEVNALVDRLEARGSELVLGECLVFEAIEGGETTLCTFVAFGPVSGPGESAIIACIEKNGKLALSPAVFSASPLQRSGEYVRIGENVWMNPVPFGRTAHAPGEAERFDERFWNEFWNCLYIHIPSQAVACAIGCAWMPLSYIQCTFTCVAAQSLTTVVRCFVSTGIAQALEDSAREKE